MRPAIAALALFAFACHWTEPTWTMMMTVPRKAIDLLSGTFHSLD